MSRADSSRLQFLESIRGLAALVVVFHHTMLAFWPFMTIWGASGLARASPEARFIATSPLAVLYDGPFAVLVFFALSGFVLSYSFFQRPSHARLTSAALRRYFRLAVPVLAAVLLSFVVMKLHGNHNVEAAIFANSEWLGMWGKWEPRLFNNDFTGALRAGLYGALFNSETGYDSVLWSMSVELPGSMLVYAFLAVFGMVRKRWLLYVVAVLLLAWSFDRPFFCLFFLGIALCDGYVRLASRGRTFDLRWSAWPLLVLGLALGGYRGWPALPAVLARWAPYFGLTGAVLVVAVPLFSATMRRGLESKLLAWLGRISFGLYLVHCIVLLSLSSAVYWNLIARHGWSSNGAACAAFAVEVVASLFFGWLMYLAADRPSIALGRWIETRLFDQESERIEPEVVS